MKFNIVQRFLFRAAGANRDYLHKCPVTEHIKYEGIGALICLTAIAAGISMFIAVSIVWEDNQWYQTAVIALIWATFIFTIDRFIVSSMRLTEHYGWRFVQALPRLFLALVIGVIIARPIEIKIFEPEIRKYLSSKYLKVADEINRYIDKEQEHQNALASKNYKSQLDSIDEKLTFLEDKIEEMNKDIDEFQRQYSFWSKESIEELDGSGGSREKGNGPIYREKNEKALNNADLMRKAKQDLFKLERQRDDLQGQKDTLTDKVDKERLNLPKEIQQTIEQHEGTKTTFAKSGFLDFNIALSHLGETPHNTEIDIEGEEEIKSIVFSILTSITALFIFIETVPVLIKILAPLGPYDDILDSEREMTKANHLSSHKTIIEVTEHFRKKYEEVNKRATEQLFASIKSNFDNVEEGETKEILVTIREKLFKRWHVIFDGLDGLHETMFASPVADHAPLDQKTNSTKPIAPHSTIKQWQKGEIKFQAFLLVFCCLFVVILLNWWFTSIGMNMHESIIASTTVGGGLVMPVSIWYITFYNKVLPANATR